MREVNYFKKSVSWLKKYLWEKLFSPYIRKRDKGKCYTCGVVSPWKEMQAGHMIPCTCEELRFNEDNVHCQCYSCNIMKYGNLTEYHYRFIKQYDIGLFNAFVRIKNQSHKHWKTKELVALIEKYKKL